MSDPKVKSITTKKAVSLLNRIAGGNSENLGLKRSDLEKVTVISGSATKPEIKHVVVKKSLFTTYPSERSVEFMRRSDEATSAGAWLTGRRHGGG